MFLVAAFAALPKQLASVYLGTGTVDANGHSASPLLSLLLQPYNPLPACRTTRADAPYPHAVQLTRAQTIIKYVVIALTIILTLLAMRYVNARIDLAKHRVIYRRRKARQARFGHSSAAALASASSFSLRPSRNRDVEDGEDGDTAPLVAHAADYGHGYALGRPSMDDAQVHAPPVPSAPAPAHPHLSLSSNVSAFQSTQQYDQTERIPTFAPPRSPSPPQTTVYTRYDDAYGGRDTYAAGGLRGPASRP